MQYSFTWFFCSRFAPPSSSSSWMNSVTAERILKTAQFMSSFTILLSSKPLSFSGNFWIFYTFEFHGFMWIWKKQQQPGREWSTAPDLFQKVVKNQRRIFSRYAKNQASISKSLVFFYIYMISMKNKGILQWNCNSKI